MFKIRPKMNLQVNIQARYLHFFLKSLYLADLVIDLLWFHNFNRIFKVVDTLHEDNIKNFKLLSKNIFWFLIQIYPSISKKVNSRNFLNYSYYTSCKKSIYAYIQPEGFPNYNTIQALQTYFFPSIVETIFLHLDWTIYWKNSTIISLFAMLDACMRSNKIFLLSVVF